MLNINIMLLLFICFFFSSCKAEDQTSHLNNNQRYLSNIIFKEMYYMSLNHNRVLSDMLINSARGIFEEYKENPFRAEEKYQNKIVVITGKVKKIQKDYNQILNLSLQGGQYFGCIETYFHKDHKWFLSSLSIGTEVSIVYRGGSGDYTYPSFSDCSPISQWLDWKIESLEYMRRKKDFRVQTLDDLNLLSIEESLIYTSDLLIKNLPYEQILYKYNLLEDKNKENLISYMNSCYGDFIKEIKKEEYKDIEIEDFLKNHKLNILEKKYCKTLLKITKLQQKE